MNRKLIAKSSKKDWNKVKTTKAYIYAPSLVHARRSKNNAAVTIFVQKSTDIKELRKIYAKVVLRNEDDDEARTAKIAEQKKEIQRLKQELRSDRTVGNYKCLRCHADSSWIAKAR